MRWIHPGHSRRLCRINHTHGSFYKGGARTIAEATEPLGIYDNVSIALLQGTSLLFPNRTPMSRVWLNPDRTGPMAGPKNRAA